MNRQMEELFLKFKAPQYLELPSFEHNYYVASGEIDSILGLVVGKHYRYLGVVAAICLVTPLVQ